MIIIDHNFSNFDLEGSEYKVLFKSLLSHTGNDNSCFPSYQTISVEAGISKSQAIRAVKSMIEKGLIKKETRVKISQDGKKRNYTNIYTLNPVIKTTGAVKWEEKVTSPKQENTSEIVEEVVAPMTPPSSMDDTTPSSMDDTLTTSPIITTSKDNYKKIKKEKITSEEKQNLISLYLETWQAYSPTDEELQALFRQNLNYGKYKTQTEAVFDINQLTTIFKNCKNYYLLKSSERACKLKTKPNPATSLGQWVQKETRVYPINIQPVIQFRQKQDLSHKIGDSNRHMEIPNCAF